MRSAVDQKGFSIIELLVVVIIIGVIAAIAIPALLKSRRAANEASAASNLRTVHSAQVTYLAIAGNNAAYGDFAALSTTQGLIDSSWGAASVIKNTYSYALERGASDSKYCASAISSDGSAKDFGVSSDGVIYEAAHGTLVCSGGDLSGALTVLGAN